MSRLMLSSAASMVLLGLLAAPASGTELDATGQRAVRAFDEICLTNAGSLEAARQAAMGSKWAFKPAQNANRKDGKVVLEGFDDNGVELVFRSGPGSSFGCNVLYTMPDEADPADLGSAISKLPGLTVKTAGSGRTFRATWEVDPSSANARVSLTIYSGVSPKTPIIALESKGSKAK